MPPQNQPSLKDKKIIFKYKDSKIVKSPGDNKHLHECTTEDLKREISQAFKIKQEKWKMKELQNLNCFWKIRGCLNEDRSFIYNSIECSEEEIEVDVYTDDAKVYLVDIKTHERGVLQRNRADFDRKIIFCKSVAYFYKNWKKDNSCHEQLKEGRGINHHKIYLR